VPHAAEPKNHTGHPSPLSERGSISRLVASGTLAMAGVLLVVGSTMQLALTQAPPGRRALHRHRAAFCPQRLPWG